MSIKNLNFQERKTSLIGEAKSILERKVRANPEQKFELATQLRKIGEHSYGRKLCARARKAFIQDPVLRFRLRLLHAWCTLDDASVPVCDRLERALEIISEEEDLNTTRNQQTLVVAGTIHKRKWEADTQQSNLEQALTYYLRGYNEGPMYDFGYTGISAAYVLDQLAALQQVKIAGDESLDIARLRRDQARAIRKNLVSILPKLFDENEWLHSEWFPYDIIIEAYFGLNDYQNARNWLDKATTQELDDWQFDLTARRLADLALLQFDKQSQSQGALTTDELINGDVGALLKDFLRGASIRGLFTGKVGLALSGGGFRASLFHIGVLAKLAELDVLRSVEVLSCVSGGAVIGTQYYLELRKLLESKSDEAITREDYIALVQRLERDFLAGVQRNIRMRAAANLVGGLKSVFRRAYSRSNHLGDLFETELFARVDHENHKRLFLNELLIRPFNTPEGFTPGRDNWRRTNKVPALVLNSTTLNTGHNWQFTVTEMGETPADINRSIDANAYLRAIHYNEAPEPFKQMPLGRAVAASVAIPGICEPIVLTDLYPDMTVRLVDGGVHGSQGVTALLERDCNVLLVCDATGEIETQKEPGSGLLEVPLRSSNVTLTQTRALLFDELNARRKAKLLRGLMYLHLMKGLDGETLVSRGANEPKSLDEDAVPLSRRGPSTAYGIRKDVQASLASIRTDLDSFSDVEAFSLMTAGYRMTEFELANSIPELSSPQIVRPSWRFLALEEPMKRAGSVDLINGTLQLLKAATNRGFKVWRLSRLAQLIVVFLVAIALAGLCFLIAKFGNAFSFQLDLRDLLIGLAILAGALLVSKAFLVLRNIPKSLTEIAMDLGLVISGFVAARVYLILLDPFYLKTGAVSQLSPVLYEEEIPPAPAPAPGEHSGIISRAVNTTQNVGTYIQKSRPAQAVGQAVGRFVDPSDPTTNKFVDRNILVEALCRLFETAGYQALRFPRSKELNPLSINLDFIARKENRLLVAEVKTEGEGTTPVDWKVALELEVAMQALRAKSQQLNSESQNANQDLPALLEIKALLILVNVTTDSSLESFVEGKAIKTIAYTDRQMFQIYDKAGKLLQLLSVGENDESKDVAQIETVWAELKSYLEPLTGVEEKPIPIMSRSLAEAR